jgi:hypothetical protein
MEKKGTAAAGEFIVCSIFEPVGVGGGGDKKRHGEN